MALTMHSASVPIFVRMLGNLVTWLDKAEAHATAKKFEPSVFLAARLAPDSGLAAADPDRLRRRQVLRRPPGRSRGAALRRRREDLGELRQRVLKTIDYVKSVPAERSTAATRGRSPCRAAPAR